MPASMTGFGRAEKESGGRTITVEARSVNHRFLEYNIKVNGRSQQFDDLIRKAVKSRFSRGYFDIQVSIAVTEAAMEVAMNEPLLKGYMAVAQKLSERYGVPYPPSIGDLLQIRDLFTLADVSWTHEEAWGAIGAALDEALGQLEAMRRSEGGHIAADLTARFGRIGGLVEQIGALAASNESERFDQLKERVLKLAQTIDLDEARLIHEAAILADRSDVSEELTRLESHLKQSVELLDSGGPLGRKLEFLVQEINREVNTIGSKAPVVEITNLVVEIKSELEKIREQAQNVE